MDLFQLGNFQLASGNPSSFKIECDALSSDEWMCLARMILDRIQPFSQVLGVPGGGIPLAYALHPHCTEGPLLIVDDVWTTGGSMNRFRAHFNRESLGAVVFARNPVQPWVTPLWTLTKVEP